MPSKGSFEGLRADLKRVLNEHDFIFKSLTFTASERRTHGSLNFDTEGQAELALDDGEKKSGLSTKEA
jgi:hypothetical protein